MLRRVIKIGRWLAEFIFVVDKKYMKESLDFLYDAGAKQWVLEQASELIERCEYNCGFTFTNPSNHQAVVVIGPTTSGAEFQDTLAHEVHHLAVAIAAEIGIDLESETPAYMAGDSIRSLADVICELGCACCHKNPRQSEVM